MKSFRFFEKNFEFLTVHFLCVQRWLFFYSAKLHHMEDNLLEFSRFKIPEVKFLIFIHF